MSCHSAVLLSLLVRSVSFDVNVCEETEESSWSGIQSLYFNFSFHKMGESEDDLFSLCFSLFSFLGVRQRWPPLLFHGV